MAGHQLEDVIQRWRQTREQDFTAEDRELFLNAGHTCIAQGDSKQLLDFIKDEANRHVVRSMGCGLLPPLLKKAQKSDTQWHHSQLVLNHLIQICKEKELLDGLIKQVDETDPGAIADSIIALMPLIQSVLLRTRESQGSGLSSALDSIQKQISKLPVPYTHKQEQEDVYGLCRCCTALLNFVEPFVQEVKNQDINLRSALSKFCLKSLREPLLHVQLDKEVNVVQHSPMWTFATEIMAILAQIHQSLPNLLFDHLIKRKEDACDLKESRACMAYLLFVHLIAMEVFPAVFCPVFVLQCNMEYVNILLSRKDESWILKGLDLNVKSLERIPDNSLSVELLELKQFHEVPQNLVIIMTDCPIQHLKQMSLVVFQLFIEKLSGEAKHMFFRRIMRTSHHAGVESVIIKNIKNQAEQSRMVANKDVWFEKTRLISLLRDTVVLPQDHETDLLHGMDRVMVSLNLLRYLLLQERQIWTGIWNDLCHISEGYTQSLRLCLGMSKSYFQVEFKRIKEDRKIKIKEFKETPDKKAIQRMTVKTDNFGSMSHEEQAKVLECALVTFDLMESIVVCIEEIIEEAQVKNMKTD